jgi:hypothetical protein
VGTLILLDKEGGEVVQTIETLLATGVYNSELQALAELMGEQN